MIAGLLKGCGCWIEDTPAGMIRYTAYQRGRLQIMYAQKQQTIGRKRPTMRPLALDVDVGRLRVFEMRWDDDGTRGVVASTNWFWTKYLRTAQEKDIAVSPTRQRPEAASRGHG